MDRYNARRRRGRRRGSAAGGTIGVRQVLAAADAGVPVVGGRVIVGGGDPPRGTTGAGTAPIPVVLDRKPDFDDSFTVAERIVWAGLDAVRKRGCEDRGRRKRRTVEEVEEAGAVAGAAFHPRMMGAPRDGATAGNNPTPQLLRTPSQDVASLLTLTEGQLRSEPSELRPTGQYLLGVACACMASVAPCVAHDPDGARAHGVRYPVILMDELFDAEHPSMAENCGAGILNVVRLAGVVISATHRPGHFCGMASRTIALERRKSLDG